MADKEESGRLMWAQRILEKELKRDVVINDDGSLDGMYDLRIGPVGAPEMAIECVGAVDQVFTETWNIGPAQDPLQLSIRGDWRVVIAKEARINRIRQHVEGLLRELEDRRIYDVIVNHLLKQQDAKLFNDLESLGIKHAHCFRLQGTGEVHLGMLGSRGMVDIQGSTVPEWICEFLRSPRRIDVLDKLDNSGAAERHVFVFVSFGGAPRSVKSYLFGNLEHLPVAKPNLPFPVTGVWIAFQFGTQGIRWDGAKWRLFET